VRDTRHAGSADRLRNVHMHDDRNLGHWEGVQDFHLAVGLWIIAGCAADGGSSSKCLPKSPRGWFCSLIE
jgi:hypothetical protein